MSVEKSCLVFGGTGLVGKKLILQLTSDTRYKKVIVANRTIQNYPNSKIEERIIDYNNLEDSSALFNVDDVFICLGTTIKKAGSKKAFEMVDLEYPKVISQLSKKFGVKTLVHISVLGANPKSSNFYVKTKGRAEEEISKLGPMNSYAVRPSMLFGNREEFRIGESIGKFFMKSLAFLMIGGLKKYRGIYDVDVANSMIFIVNSKPKQKIFDSEELIAISNSKM